MKNILFICLAALLFAACKKDQNVSPNPAAEDYFFTGKLSNGDTLNFEIKSSSNAEMVISNVGSLNPPNCTYSYGCGIGTAFGEPGEKSVGITFSNLFSGNCGDQLTTFPNLFTPGIYPFGETSGKNQNELKQTQ